MRMLVACACLLVAPAAGAQKLDLKLGAWEMTMKSPALKQPIVEKECVTKADLAQFAGGADADDDCKYTKPPAVKGRTWSAEKTCPRGHKVYAEITADTPERVRGTIRTETKGKTETIQTAGRWLGASCKGIK